MTIDQKLMAQLTDSPTRISIEKLIGEDLFNQLSGELGGHQIYIPANPSDGCPLAVCIGIDAARKMGEVWGGMEYEVPVMAGRRQRILKMLEAGMKITRVSAHLKISIRTVRRIASEAKADNQLTLPLNEDLREELK